MIRNWNILQKKISINPLDFGAKGDGIADDREALLNTFRYAMDNELEVDLLKGKTYLIDSIDSDWIFTLDKPLTIKGLSTIKIGAIGDYNSLFRLGNNDLKFIDFTVDSNTRGNNLTVNTGPLNRRCVFYTFSSPTIENIYFDNIKMKDCVGVWLLVLRANNVTITNCEFEFAKT